MRPTLLNHRHPDERTPDFRFTRVNNQGDHMGFDKYATEVPVRSTVIGQKFVGGLTQDMKRGMGVTEKRKVHGDFSQDARFKDAGVFCEGTGMSIYTGPGTYEEHIAY